MSQDFIKEIDDFCSDISSGIDTVAKKTAKESFEYLVDKSPVWTGAYVKSHRIGINKKSSTPPVTVADLEGGVSESGHKKFPPKVSAAEAQKIKSEALGLTSKLMTAKAINQLVISNSVKHVSTVEYELSHVCFTRTTEYAKIILAGLVKQLNNTSSGKFGLSVGIKGSK